MADRDPWETAPSSTARDPWEAPPTVAADVGRALFSGPAKALGKFLVAPGEGAAIEMNAAGTGDRLEGVPTQADVERRIPRAQTIPGRIVENVGEIAANPISWFGPGSWITKLLSIGGAGVAGQLGEETGVPGLGTAAGIAGGGVGGVASSSLERMAARANRLASAPTAGDLRSITRGRYQTIMGNERAAALSDKLTNALEGSTTGNDLRRKLRGIIQDPDIDPQHKQAMREIIGNRELSDKMAGMFRLGWHGPSVYWAIHSALEGHFGRAAALVGTDAAVELANLARRGLDRSRVAGRVEDLRESVLRNAPSGGGPAPPLQSRFEELPGALLRGAQSPDLSDLANRER